MTPAPLVEIPKTGIYVEVNPNAFKPLIKSGKLVYVSRRKALNIEYYAFKSIQAANQAIAAKQVKLVGKLEEYLAALEFMKKNEPLAKRAEYIKVRSKQLRKEKKVRAKAQAQQAEGQKAEFLTNFTWAGVQYSGTGNVINQKFHNITISPYENGQVASISTILERLNKEIRHSDINVIFGESMTNPIIIPYQQATSNFKPDAFKLNNTKQQIDNWIKGTTPVELADIFRNEELIRANVNAPRNEEERKERLEVQAFKPAHTEFSFQETKYNCVIEFLASSLYNGKPFNILSHLTEEELKNAKDENRFETLDYVYKLAKRLNIPFKLINPTGETIYELKKEELTNKNYSKVYGLVVNKHIHILTEEQMLEAKDRMRHVNSRSKKFYDNTQLNDVVAELIRNNEKRPIYVTATADRIESFNIEGVQHIAAKDYEVFQSIAERLALVVDNYSAPCIAKAIINRYAIPRENVLHGPVRDLYENNHLESPYYCDKDIMTYPQEQIAVRDMTACHWSILCDLPHFLICSPFDEIQTFTMQRINSKRSKTAFYICEDAPLCPDTHQNFNNRMLTYELVDFLNLWQHVKLFVQPSRVLTNNNFAEIDNALKVSTDYNKARKLISNCVVGQLGKIWGKCSNAWLSTDAFESCTYTNVTLNDQPFYIHKVSGGRFPINNNRAIYLQVINENHIRVIKLARAMKKEFGGNVVKVKVDSVAVMNVKPSQVEQAPIAEVKESEVAHENNVDDFLGLYEFCDFSTLIIPQITQNEFDARYELNFNTHEEDFNPLPPNEFYLQRRTVEQITRDLPTEYSTTPNSKPFKFIHAAARMGKTHYINNVLNLSEKNSIYLAPTNVALSKLNKKSTKTVQAVCTYECKLPKNITTVIIDEVSMCSSVEMAMIMNYCIETQRELVISGDYHQLPSVENSLPLHLSQWYKQMFQLITIDWHDRCGISREKFDVMERFKVSHDLTELIEKQTPMPADAVPLYLAYTNKRVDEYKATIEKPVLYRTCRMGRPTQGEHFVNNQLVIKMNDAEGKPKYYHYDNGEELKVKEKDLEVCQACTVHRMQGSSTVNPFGIKFHLIIDISRFNYELAYTAFTRCPDFSYSVVGKVADTQAGKLRSAYISSTDGTMVNTSSPHYVYAYADPANKVIYYIGETSNLIRRAEEHLESHGRNPAHMYTVAVFYSFYEAATLERQLIKRLKPEQNIQLNKEANKKNAEKKAEKKAPVVIKTREEKLANTVTVCEKLPYIYYYIKGERKRKRYLKKGLEATMALVQEEINNAKAHQ